MGERRSNNRRRASSAAVAAGALALALASAGCGGPIQDDELKRGIESLGALASEGKLLAQDVSRNRTRMTFVRVHARELAGEADHEAEKLFDATARGRLVSPKAQAVKLAKDISGALGDLQVMAGDEATGRHVAIQLRHYASDASDLAAGL
ncbi:MAG: hypothetical protein QOI98_1563 [Solirubrobacteraceae bacterium]|jgi:hypothetical protein|nr:hypothetical protein [Solirubrobacteraceae bacterium]